MSRAGLIADAKRVGVALTVRNQGRTLPKSTDAIRLDLIERLYGPGMHWTFRSPGSADETLNRGADCALGKYGYLLSVAQGALRSANEDRAEWKRLTGLKKRRPKDEARLLRSARQWMDICRVSQELYKVDRGIQFGMYLDDQVYDH